jgi:hypothetical protein
MSLTIDDTNKGRIKLLFKERHIGDAILDVDGFYYFYPILQGGFWSEYSLTLILDKLKELNEPMNKHLEEYYQNEIKNNNSQESVKEILSDLDLI